MNVGLVYCLEDVYSISRSVLMIFGCDLVVVMAFRVFSEECWDRLTRNFSGNVMMGLVLAGLLKLYKF